MTSRSSTTSTPHPTSKSSSVRAHSATYQDKLDDALNQTFPASDPIAPGMTTRMKKPRASAHPAMTTGAQTTVSHTAMADASQTRHKAKQKAHPAQPATTPRAATTGHAKPSRKHVDPSYPEHRSTASGGTTSQASSSTGGPSGALLHQPTESRGRSR